MIKKIIQQWETNKSKLENWFRNTPQSEYDEYEKIVKAIFTHVIEGYKASEITTIDNGDYQGTQIFLIPKDTYQPDVEDYLMTNTYYGSCSGCDTLEAIREYNEDTPSEPAIKEYMTLALHLVQKLKILGNED
jgi:hypothetical protein